MDKFCTLYDFNRYWFSSMYSARIIGIGSVACIVLELYEWIRDIRIAYQKKKIENQLKKAGE